ETIQWLYLLIGSKFRLVVKTSLKLLLVFVEYSESNAPLLIQAINTVDSKRGTNTLTHTHIYTNTHTHTHTYTHTHTLFLQCTL
uniref:FHOD1/3-like FH3 domain-containing protein n=1 Tax=Cyprinus carpio TaxID=7962 RepID=A0A8C1PKF4_CYPCA